MKKASTGKGRILLIAAAILWGLAGVCIKSISWGTMSIVSVRSLLSFLVIAVGTRTIRLRFTKWNVLGAVFMTVTGILYVEAVKLTTAGTAIVLQYIAPIFVFLYAVLFQHRKARFYEIVLTVLVFSGILLSFLDQLSLTHVFGNLLALLSGVTFAAQIILMNHEGTDSGNSLMMSSLLSFLLALPFLFFDTNLTFSFQNIFWILVLGIFQYGLANLLFGFGIQKVDSVEASLLLTIEPIFNPIPVAIICGEKMGVFAIIGAAIVISAITAYQLIPKIEEKKRKECEPGTGAINETGK